MPFNRLGCSRLAYLFVACVLGTALLVAGCKENETDDSEVFVDAKDQLAMNVLPEITGEAEAVLRNLTNMLAALPEICATPLPTYGSFISAVPALGRPQSAVLVGEDDEDSDEQIFRGSWNMVWRDVVLGSDGVSMTDTPPVDITLNVRPQRPGGGTLLAIPFTLIPQSALLATATAGQPDPPQDTESFFLLFQDTVTGVWTLRWRTLETPMVFDGSITEPVFSRVIRRVSDVPGDVVESLEVGSSATLIRFREMTMPEDEKGITFFARPGELVQFELRIGPTEDNLQRITSDQLYIGSGNQQLPPGEDPDDFELATNWPIDPTGEPMFTPGEALGMFIWQDVAQNTCNVGEDQWRVRFSTTGDLTTFNGEITALEDDNDVALTFVALGGCQGNRQDGGKTLDYTCILEGAQTGGYDICVTAGRRVLFRPEVNDLEDPGLVFVGAERQPPPSPDPSRIMFDIDLEEPLSGRRLTLSDAQITLSGNSDVEGVLRLNPDQLSLDPLCGRLPAEIEAIVRPQVASAFAPGERLVQPRVRLFGGGDYASRRYDGSLYRSQEIEFLDPAVRTLDSVARFPDRGRIELETRLQGELENTVITAESEDISADEVGQVTLPVEVDLNLSRVIFKFAFDPDNPAACEACLMQLTVNE